MAEILYFPRNKTRDASTIRKRPALNNNRTAKIIPFPSITYQAGKTEDEGSKQNGPCWILDNRTKSH